MEEHQIFISYRRKGGWDVAGRISDRLKSREYRVFYDIESMRSGTFDTQILRAIDQCSDVLVILSPDALDRCVNQDDWVRQEITHALKTGKNVIPVFLPGFSFPAQLPQEIEPLRRQEGVKLINEYFDACMDRIQSLLKCTVASPLQQEDENLTKGIRFIRYGQYSLAQQCLQEAMLREPADPDAYFYMAVALLAGQQPFVAMKPVINRILEVLNAAVAIGDRALYHCLLAYVKLDYHSRKQLRTQPDGAWELSRARQLGLTPAEAAELFALLKVQKPTGF